MRICPTVVLLSSSLTCRAAFPLVLLGSLHATLSFCPLPPIAHAYLPRFVNHLVSIASPSNLVKLVQRHTSRHSTPAAPAPLGAFIAPHPSTPGGVVTQVAETLNILLATALLPTAEPHPSPFTSQDGDRPEHLQAIQTKMLVEETFVVGKENKLYSTSEGFEALGAVDKSAVRWWSELMDGGEVDGTESGRRGSLFAMGGSPQDEEVELSVAVLHLLNNLSLHQAEPESSHLARLRLLLSETSPASDPRLLEAAFVCTSIIVRK